MLEYRLPKWLGPNSGPKIYQKCYDWYKEIGTTNQSNLVEGLQKTFHKVAVPNPSLSTTFNAFVDALEETKEEGNKCFCEEVKPEPLVRLRPCGCSHHRSCVKDWLDYNPTMEAAHCPECGVSFVKTVLHFKQTGEITGGPSPQRQTDASRPRTEKKKTQKKGEAGGNAGSATKSTNSKEDSPDADKTMKDE